MFKVLLVDDNLYALKYFQNLISWKNYGFDVIDIATDGEYAFAQFQAHTPELVITDIQMPNIDGIQLAKKILQIAPQTVIIFLSSYEEFIYAKSALKLHVTEYLLKHEVTAEILIEKLAQATDMIQENHVRDRYIREQKLLNIINDIKNANTHNFSLVFKAFPGIYHLCILIQDHVYPEISFLKKLTQPELAENLMKDFLYKDPLLLAAARLEPFTYVLLFDSSGSGSGSGYETVHTLPDRFRKEFNNTVSLIVIAENSTIHNCFKSYTNIIDSLQQKFFYPPSSILSGNSFSLPETSLQQPHTRQLLLLAEKEDFTGIRQYLQNTLRSVIFARDFASFSTLVNTSLQILIFFHEKFNLSVSATETSATQDIYWYDTSSIFHWLICQFEDIENTQNTLSNKEYSKLVNSILLYIRQHYHDSDLSVESIADAFHINMNQLNYTFKKEVGHSVIKQLTQIRMETAKQLLKNRKLQISDVSSMVGYRNLSYFSNAFKKYWGTSPQYYRRDQ